MKFRPAKNQRVHQAYFDTNELAVRSASARGLQLTTKSVARISATKPGWWNDAEGSGKGKGGIVLCWRFPNGGVGRAGRPGRPKGNSTRAVRARFGCRAAGRDGQPYHVHVGTIDRKMGRVLGVTDFVPKAKWPTLKQKLYDGAVRKVEGKENLQSEVEVIENFYYDKDGLHFVYNPYEIACGATGAVEVLIDLKSL